ncbi:MAG TPA: DUF6223 family protein [Chitinophagaceae bacterium]|jgi:hypothetical protein|nr:DUF6223 family protein [Chitinophagaceae bacterium]
MKKYIPYILSACLIIGFAFLATEKAFSQTTPDGTSPYVTGLTAGRAKSLVGVFAGLISLIIGWRAKARSAHGAGIGKPWVITALVLGLLAIVLSVVHLGTTPGGFGTGGGKAGSIVALAVGLIGTILSGLTLRSKRK